MCKYVYIKLYNIVCKYIYIYAVQCPPFYWTRAWLVMRLSPEQDKETRAGATNRQGSKANKGALFKALVYIMCIHII